MYYYCYVSDTSNNTGTGINTVKSVSKAIGKYTPSLATSATAGSVNYNATNTFTATPTTISSCQGTLTAASANTSYVTITGGASNSNVASGTAKTITYKGVAVPSSGTINVNVNYAPTDTANCNSAAQKSVAITVNKVAATNPTLSDTTATYNGSAHAIGVSGGSGGTIYYRTSTDNSTWGSWSTTKPSLTNVGKIYVQAYVKGDGNHTNSSATASKAITINQRTVTITAPTVNSSTLTYSGSAQNLLATAGSCSAGGTMYWYSSNPSTSSTAPTFSTSSGWTTTAPTSTSYKGTNAGTYYMYYYCYVSDTSNNTGTGINTVKSVSKAIGKYTPSIALSATTGTVNVDSTATFNATPTTISSCQGTLTAASANTSYVTITGGASNSNVTSGTAKTVTWKGVQTTTGVNINVNYKPTDTANCNNAAQKTYSAKVNNRTLTATFSKGANTSAIGSTSGTCTISKSGTSCNVATPTITPNTNYLIAGWSTSNTATSGTWPGANVSISANTTYYGNSKNAKPTFSETTEGVVSVTYPSGCTGKYSCKYKIGSGSDTTTTSTPTTVNMGADGVITATASDGTNTVSATYTAVRYNLYVSSSGSDTTGYGTVAKPYATIAKAYTSATTTKAATIYVMNAITHSTVANMNNSSKKITLTSSNTSGVTSDSTINTVTRGSGLTSNPMINSSAGTLTLKNIEFNGNRVSASKAMLINSATTTIQTGVTFERGINNASGGSGGAIENTGTLNMTDVILNENKADHGGGVSNTGTLIIDGGFIEDNSVSVAGGGIMNWSTGTATLSGVTVTHNFAEESLTGGAGILNEGQMTITSSTITSNTAKGPGGGINSNELSNLNITSSTISGNISLDEHGGGIAIHHTATIDGCTISNNQTSTGGGGGVSVFADASSSLTTIKGSTGITYNTANSSGGGIYVAKGTLTLNNSTDIHHNTAASNGGGIYISSNSTLNVPSGHSSVHVNVNTATNGNGGGIYSGGTVNIAAGDYNSNKANTSSGWAGGIYILGGTFKLSGGNIKNNSAKYNGGIHINSGTYTRSGSPVCSGNTNDSPYPLSSNCTISGNPNV